MSEREPAQGAGRTATGAGYDGIVLLSPGSTAPAETRALGELAATLTVGDDGATVEVAHLRFAPPGLLEAVARLVDAGARRIRVVPLLLFADRLLRDHLPPLVAAARQRHPGVTITTTPCLVHSPALLGAVRTLIAGPDA